MAVRGKSLENKCDSVNLPCILTSILNDTPFVPLRILVVSIIFLCGTLLMQIGQRADVWEAWEPEKGVQKIFRE